MEKMFSKKEEDSVLPYSMKGNIRTREQKFITEEFSISVKMLGAKN